MKKRGIGIGFIVEHHKGNLVFVNQLKGPSNDYAKILNEITKDDLISPTASETASLIYAAFKDKDHDYVSQRIFQLMKDKYFWCFTGSLYVPKKGVYIQDRPKVGGFLNEVQMNEPDLVKKLEAKNPSVRFVPFGYKIGKQSSLEFSKNDFVIGQVGEEGAEKLAEIIDEPYVSYAWSFDNRDNKEKRMIALGSCWVGYSPHPFGLFHGDLRDGCAFGILKR